MLGGLYSFAQEYPYTIEKEDIHFRFIAPNTKYDNYTNNTQITVECKREMRINDPNALPYLSIPESFDPLYEDYNSAARTSGFYLDQVKIKSIEIKIRRDGKYITVVTDAPQSHMIRVFRESDLLYGEVPELRYPIKNLRSDDVVSIHYIISFPQILNQHEFDSFRIFFHGKVPKQDVTYRISKSEAASIVFNYVNAAEPHFSYKRDLITDKWHFDRLPSITDENCSRPYLEVPHIEAITSLQTFGINTLRNKIIFDNKESISIGSTYKKFMLLEDFLQSHIEDDDSTTLQKIASVYNLTALDFKYDSDDSYLKGEQLFQPNSGEDLMNQVIRESNKFETYPLILDGLRKDYWIVTPMDNRVGRFSNWFAKPFYQGVQAYAAVLENGQLLFMLPKSSQCGFYADELPYFLEGCDMNVNFAPDRSYKPKDIELSFGTRNQGWHLNRMLVPSLESSMDQNKRATNALASIEVKTGIVKVQGRVLLSGQFSTASRSNYICKEITTGVDKQYNQIVTDSIANCTLAYFKVVETNALFPFETKIELDFETRAKGLDDQIQTLDLGHWIKHIRYQIDSTHRDFDFYPDFKQSDNYSFMLEFDHEIELIDRPTHIVIQNDFGNYLLQFTFQGNRLRIVSQFKSNAHMMPSEEIHQVAEIYNAMECAGQLTLTYRSLN